MYSFHSTHKPKLHKISHRILFHLKYVCEVLSSKLFLDLHFFKARVRVKVERIYFCRTERSNVYEYLPILDNLKLKTNSPNPTNSLQHYILISPLPLNHSSLTQHDKRRRPLQRDVRHGPALLGNAGRLRLRQVVEDVHPRAVLGCEPLRGSLRGPRPLLPLHRPQQPLPNGRRVHTGRHALKGLRPRASLGLVPPPRGPARVAHHAVFGLDSAQHFGDGNPFA